MRPKAWRVVGGCVAYSLVSYGVMRLWGGPGWWPWITLMGLLGALGYGLRLARTGQEKPTPVKRVWPLSDRAFFGLVFGYVLLMLALLWSLHFPAAITGDGRNQWEQIHGGLSYTNVHAIGHTLLLKAITLVWDSYAGVVLVQVLGVALLYAVFAVFLRRRGAPEGLLLLLLALFTACASYADLYVAILKDTPYTLCVGLVTLLTMVYLSNREGFGVAKGALLGAALAGCGLMRHNGLVVTAICGTYFLCAMTRQKAWRPLGLMLAAMVFCFGAVEACSTYLLHTRHLSNGFSVAPFAKGIAAAVAQGGEITDKDQAALDDIFTPEDIQWMKDNYEPWDRSNRLLWAREYRQNPKPEVFEDRDLEVFNNRYVLALGSSSREVIRLYFQMAPRNMGLYLKDMLYNTRVLWGIEGQRWPFSNILLWGMLAMAIPWKRKAFARCWPVLLPMLVNGISIAISSVTNEYRYLLPTFTLFPVLLPYILLVGKANKAMREEHP